MDKGASPTSRTDGISRAQFLHASLAAGAAVSVGGWLAACGGDDDDSSSTTGGSADSSNLPVAPTGGAVAGPLVYYGWQGYDFPDPTKRWMQRENVDLKASYIATWQDIPPKLRAGQSYDVVSGDNAYNKIFEELRVLTRMESAEELVPAVSEINQTYVDRFRLEDGSLVGVPFSWGTWGIVYNTETVEAVPTKWSDLLEPEFKGRVGMLDDVGPSINIAALQNGIENYSQLNQGQLNEAIAYLSKMKDQAKTISPSWGDVISLLEKGEIDVVWEAWPALKLFVGKGTKLDVVFPEDRSVSYVNTYWVPTTAKHPAAAYGFMNEVLSPEVQLEIPAGVGEAIVRTDSAADLPKDLAGLYPYDDVDAFIEQHPFYSLPKLKESGDVTSYTEWTAAWNQMKA